MEDHSFSIIVSYSSICDADSRRDTMRSLYRESIEVMIAARDADEVRTS